MKCPRCQGENTAQARFCVQCGFDFRTAAQGGGTEGGVCTKCGTAFPAGVRFCAVCGAPVRTIFSQQTMPEDDSEGTMILDENGMESGDDSEGTMILDENGMESGDDSEGTMILDEAANDLDGTVILENTDAPFMGGPINSMSASGSAGQDRSMPFMANQSDETTMLNDSMGYMQNHSVQTSSNSYGNSGPVGNRVQPGQQPANSAPGQNAPRKKSGGNRIVIAVIAALGVLIAAAAVVLVLVWKGQIKLPFELPFLSSVVEETNDKSDSPEKPDAADDQDKTKITSEQNPASGVSEEQLSDANALLESGKSKIASPDELMDGIDDIRSAMDQYKALTEEYGMSEAVSEQVAEAYDAYVSAVIKHKDLMAGQDLSGAIYTQVTSEFDNVAAYAEELTGAGFDIDSSLLESERDGFVTSYRTRVIKAFNEFASRESWSRTEAWNLMDDMDSMFEAGDLDDPIRLRYCYALAWWIQRQCETELRDGMITEKGAATKIANVIQATDYNPMLIDYYIGYKRSANEDCSEVEKAFYEIIERIEAQGLAEDVSLDHFWYFNDFGEYSVDDTNGVTPENRQWIRERMSSVEF